MLARDVEDVLMVGDGDKNDLRRVPCTEYEVRRVAVGVDHPSAFVDINGGTLKNVVQTSCRTGI